MELGARAGCGGYGEVLKASSGAGRPGSERLPFGRGHRAGSRGGVAGHLSAGGLGHREEAPTAAEPSHQSAEDEPPAWTPPKEDAAAAQARSREAAEDGGAEGGRGGDPRAQAGAMVLQVGAAVPGPGRAGTAAVP